MMAELIVAGDLNRDHLRMVRVVVEMLGFRTSPHTFSLWWRVCWCMIIFLSPLHYNSTLFLYSPTILLEKNGRVINYCCCQVNHKWTKNQARHKISNSTSSRNSKLGEILISVVQFHLVHLSVQVATWWWYKFLFGLIGTTGLCIDFIDSGALLEQYQ